MTLKVDGTNGVLQAYDYQVLTTGFSYTFAAGTQTLIANPAGTLATGTVTMPASPVDGMVITVQSTQQITALTIQGNTGQSFVGGAVTLRANKPLSFMYRLSNTTWYPFSGASNSDVILGTSVASTSGTSIDFTGIPSWVRRITIVLNGTGTNGASQKTVQLGTSSGVDTASYTSSGFGWTGGINGTTITNGILMDGQTPVANNTYNAVMVLNYFGSNQWVGTSISMITNSTAGQFVASGAKTLSGTLDRVRITTTGGANTFNAGSINILYE